jgi:uncharacterized protein (TIGR02996 family)
VTTEDDFQKKLDENPDDWQTRLVFADWLEERGDERASGYRALARLNLKPGFTKAWEKDGPGRFDWWYWTRISGNGQAQLRNEHYETVAAFNQMPDWECIWWAYFRSRREAEDAAAIALVKLPAELLNPTLQETAK